MHELEKLLVDHFFSAGINWRSSRVWRLLSGRVTGELIALNFF